MPLNELKPHLFTLPERPDWVPYRTSYYKEDWGFCLSHNQMLSLEDGDYALVSLVTVGGVEGGPVKQDELMIEIGGKETVQ